MVIIILGVIVLFFLAYYAYTNAINIICKMQTRKDYSEKEFKDDKILGGIAFGIIIIVMVVLGLIN